MTTVTSTTLPKKVGPTYLRNSTCSFLRWRTRLGFRQWNKNLVQDLIQMKRLRPWFYKKRKKKEGDVIDHDDEKRADVLTTAHSTASINKCMCER